MRQESPGFSRGEEVNDTHSSAFTIIGLLDNELAQRLS